MNGLIEQCREIVEMSAAALMQAPVPCSGCNEHKLCIWHRFAALAQRKMNRSQYEHMRADTRRRRYEREQQAEDEANFREQNGYAMPYSMRPE